MDFSEYQDVLAEKVREGNVVLFIGAGASMASGGPSGSELATFLKTKFPRSDQTKSDLFDVCQDVIDTPPYDRVQLEEAIRGNLEQLQPTESHTAITQHQWGSIFTTNYDDLIELAYRTASTLTRCQPISSDNFQVNIGDKSRVYLFKLMGSMNVPDGESGEMVLSRSDINKAYVRRRKYFELLADFVKTSTLLFVGYSFKDRLVLDLMEELIDLYGENRVPWSYAIFDKIENDQKTETLFARHRIIPLECGFEKLMESLSSSAVASPVPQSASEILVLKGRRLAISANQARIFSADFEFLSESRIQEHHGDMDDFFRGINQSWGVFREDWDFQREMYGPLGISPSETNINYPGSLKNRIFHEAQNTRPEDNKVILVRGIAGCGKTVMLRRIAFDFYSSGEVPVILIRTLKTNLDYRSITAFLELLNDQLIYQVGIESRPSPLKLLIIVDDASVGIRHLNRLKDFLTSRGRSVLIIAAARSGEWDSAFAQNQFNLPSRDVYEIPDRLANIERKNLVAHLHRLGFLEAASQRWDDYIKDDLDGSFFAAAYVLVDPAKRPLNAIIQSQYQGLGELSQNAFRYLSALHQFNLPMNLELLVRSLGCTYEEFYSNVVGNDADGVLFSEEDAQGNILYRTHHRIVAQRIVNVYFGDPEQQKEIFLQVLSNCRLASRVERHIVVRLLLEHLGPNATPKLLVAEQQRQLFSIVCDRDPIRSIVHHWGIIESDEGNSEEANRLLNWALELPREESDSFRGESDQNILTSLGTLYSRLGIESLRGNDGTYEEIEEYFSKAERFFDEAKFGEFPNAYAYHAQANMWLQRSQDSEDELDRVNQAGIALQVLSVAEDNLNPADMQPLLELETRIWALLGDKNHFEPLIQILKDKYKTARGYYVVAEMLRKEAVQSPDKKPSLLHSALDHVDEGLAYFPADEHCARMRVQLLRELEDHNDSSEYFAALQKWGASATHPNAQLLYELGRTAFVLGYYDSSRSYFQELQTGVGIGHQLRTRPRNPILDDDGNIREFQGFVVRTEAPHEGFIRCDNLRSLRSNLHFTPIAAGFTPVTDDAVKFQIEFSFRGPTATKVEKV